MREIFDDMIDNLIEDIIPVTIGILFFLGAFFFTKNTLDDSRWNEEQFQQAEAVVCSIYYNEDIPYDLQSKGYLLEIDSDKICVKNANEKLDCCYITLADGKLHRDTNQLQQILLEISAGCAFTLFYCSLYAAYEYCV